MQHLGQPLPSKNGDRTAGVSSRVPSLLPLLVAVMWALPSHARAAGEVTVKGATNTGQHSAAHPTVRAPAQPQAQLAVVLDGPTILESGSTYDAHLIALDSSESAPLLGALASSGLGSEIVFALIQAPAGLTLDPVSGALHWVPGDDQVGSHVLEVRGSSPTQSQTAEFLLNVQGLAVESQALVPAATGGWIRVLSPGSSVAGSSILIAPGALGSSQMIELCTPLQSLQLPGISQGLYVLPAQELGAPAELEIGYSDAWLVSAGIADETKLAIFELEEATGQWHLLSASVPLPQSNKVKVPTPRLGRFAVFVRDSVGLVPSVAQQLDSFCQLYFGGGQSGVAPDSVSQQPEQVLSTPSNLNQPRRFVTVKGDRFEPGETNALVLHGLFSSDQDVANLSGWAAGRYDNVKVYDYPSGESIQGNARWLGIQLVTDLSNFQWGACIDVYAHSMGGLVARGLVEDEHLYGCRSFAPFVHLATLGAPHLGAPVPPDLPPWIHPENVPGIKDLLVGSEFLDHELNLPPGQGWSRYVTLAGGSAVSSDGFVSVASAVPLGLFEILGAELFPSENHSSLHQGIETNGVREMLQYWIHPKTIRADQIEVIGSVAYATHDPLGPFEIEEHWKSVELTITVRLEEDFFQPPWVPISIRWQPLDPQLGPRELEFEKEHLFLDDSYPEVLALLQTIPGAFVDDPLKQTALHLGPTGRELTFTRSIEDVPVCYPPDYVPQPGVPIPLPDLHAELWIGYEPDLVFLFKEL